MSTLRIAIVGAGPVGLTAALLLQRHGLSATVYERRDDIARLPQAHVVNTRSCEIFRELGIFEVLAKHASQGELGFITWRDAVAGTCFGVLPVEGSPEQKARRRAASPVRTLNMGQDVIGQILLDTFIEAGGAVLFEHAVRSAGVEDGKAVLQVQAEGREAQRELFDVVLACDGAASVVRQSLGIAMQGPASLARFASCYFKADLNHHFGPYTGPVHFVGGRGVQGTLISFDMKETWALMCVTPPNATREQFSEQTMLELVRRAVGAPEAEIELISVGGWNMSAQVATELRHGPFFLVGDAAHRFPPSGGLGLNTGVQDAHNLAWKLAQVARGGAGDALLDTYMAERLPIAARNCEHSVNNTMKLMEIDAASGVQFMAPVDPAVVTRAPVPAPDYGLDGDSPAACARRERTAQAIAKQRPHFDALRIELGYRYGENELEAGADYDLVPGLAVGARLPHAWLDVDGQRRSTLDLPCTGGYTLLVAGPAHAWDGVAAQLDKYHVKLLGVAQRAPFSEEVRAAVVRPDGHVLWCGAAPDQTLFAAIDQLHAGQIARDAAPVRVMSDNQKATMTVPARRHIRPSKLAHVVLRSNVRFEAMAEWYRSLLSAHYVHKDATIAFMTYDDEHHRIAIALVPGMVDRPPGTVGVEHIAFTFGTMADLLETYARLKQDGTEPILAINHGPTTSLYYEDPDRNRVELQVDNFDSLAELTAFLQTGVLAVNPMGVAFDPDDLLASVRAGVTEKTLKAYPLPAAPVDPKMLTRLYQN